QWARELERFAPGLDVHVHHGPDRLAGAALLARAEASDVVISSYDVVARDLETVERVAWDRLILDEAQDAKNPAAAGARDDRDADRELARRALGDHGPRQPGAARLAPGLRADVRAADRGGPRRPRPRAAAEPRRPVPSPPGQGRAGGRPGAAADHDREAVVPPHRRTGEPLPRDGRSLDAPDRRARAALRPPGRSA